MLINCKLLLAKFPGTYYLTNEAVSKGANKSKPQRTQKGIKGTIPFLSIF